MKIKVAVPNSRNSSTSKASKAVANLKVSTESESKSERSEDERSEVVVVVSSPVIKVYGSTLEATEVADRINPNGASERKSGLNGMSEKEAPVSNTIGRVEAGSKFGWRGGTESEVAVVAEATTVGARSTVAVEATTGGAGAVSTVAVTTEVDGVGEWMSPIRELNR